MSGIRLASDIVFLTLKPLALVDILVMKQLSRRRVELIVAPFLQAVSSIDGGNIVTIRARPLERHGARCA
jgi:hypothetical protein